NASILGGLVDILGNYRVRENIKKYFSSEDAEGNNLERIATKYRGQNHSFKYISNAYEFHRVCI
ncbi:9434_t:CDS:2, partial [Cetraspora pellucida]